MSLKRGSTTFKPRARIIKVLGEELITNEVIALVELVKNSYDADATIIEVNLENVTDIENGRILIKDNGSGMSLDTVLNAWLQPGTENKKKLREKIGRSRVFNRPILGEKGVGRFAAQKLGSLISLTTRSQDDELETIVEIDWRDFEKEKFLSEVDVNWIQSKPNVFKENTGTLIEINFILKKWTESMVENLAQKLSSLQSPFEKTEAFKILLRSNDFPELAKEAKFPKQIFKKMAYSFAGQVSAEGVLVSSKYRFVNPAFKKFNREIVIDKEDIRDPDYFKTTRGLRFPNCGAFSFEFFVWDLDPSSLKETIGVTEYRKFVKPLTGVRVYRDNFRVWPYGEKGNDWLGLDPRRVNTPTKCLSNNQIIGMIKVRQIENPKLVDKTDREGLIENTEFNDFKNLVLSVINKLEILRYPDKSSIAKLRDRKIGKKIDETLDTIEKTRKKIQKNNHEDFYLNDINEIEKAYQNYKVDVVEKFYVAAGIGIAALMPAHEIQIQLKDLKPHLQKLKEDVIHLGLGGRVTDRFESIYGILEILNDVSEGALELTKREYKTFSLSDAVNAALHIKELELKRNDVKLILEEDKEIKIKGYQNLVITAILNLLDNSLWWLQKNQDEKRIKITIKKDPTNNPLIIVSDNGPGIDPADLPYLGDVFYTHKPNGTGLGLFITNRAMEANEGKIDFGFFPNDSDYLEGANVLLIFEKSGD